MCGPGRYIGAALMLLTVATLVSMSMSFDVRQSALGSAPMLPACLLFCIVRYRLSPGHAHILLLSLMALAALTSVSIVVAWSSGTSANPHLWIRGASRIIAVPNDTLILAILSPVATAIFFHHRRTLWRVGALLTLLLGVIAIVLVQSRLAIVVMVVAQLVTLVTLRRFNARWLLAIAAAAVVADAITGFGLLNKFLDAREESRIALWWAAGAMFLDAPILGHGPNTFGELRLAFLASYPEKKWFGIDQGYVAWPHNLYLELLAERGVFALAGFCAALLVALKASRRLYRNAAGDARMIAICSFGALLSIAFAGIAELSMLHLWVPVITFTFLALVAMIDSAQRELE
jgi:O-antigen ligase